MKLSELYKFEFDFITFLEYPLEGFKSEHFSFISVQLFFIHIFRLN